MKVLGVTLAFLSLTGALFAGNPSPEIDASTGSAALALLSGGMLMLRSRRKK